MAFRKKSRGFDIRKVKGRDQKIYAKWFNSLLNSKTKNGPKVTDMSESLEKFDDDWGLSEYFGIWLLIAISLTPLSPDYLGLISFATLGKIWFLSLPVLLLICFYKQLEKGKINFIIILILTLLFYFWSKNDVWRKFLE